MVLEGKPIEQRGHRETKIGDLLRCDLRSVVRDMATDAHLSDGPDMLDVLAPQERDVFGRSWICEQELNRRSRDLADHGVVGDLGNGAPHQDPSADVCEQRLYMFERGLTPCLALPVP